MERERRNKIAAREEIRMLQELNWVPVNLSGEALPSWLRGIPKDKLVEVWGSGSYNNLQYITKDGSELNAVAGYDVFRYDAKDEPKGHPINKDHYIVFIDSSRDERYLVKGPIIDDDHWLNDLPNEHPEITIMEVPPRET